MTFARHDLILSIRHILSALQVYNKIKRLGVFSMECTPNNHTPNLTRPSTDLI